MRSIAHIINPVMVDSSSDLYTAQPVTFETMKIAKEFAARHVDVRLFSSQFAEDREFIPGWFQRTPDLDRSILDINNFHKSRKLPLIKDILDRLYQEDPDADYLIYTNVDIALMPHFYLSVNSIIDSGYDAFTINRRTISNKYKSSDQIPLMFSEIGETHPGYDCFIFKRNLYPNFGLGTACIGTDWIGRLLILNLICHSENFKILNDLHLTFHIGNDKRWKLQIFEDYIKHNHNEITKILMDYKTNGVLKNVPLIHNFLNQVDCSDFNSNQSSHEQNRIFRLIDRVKKYIKRY